MLSVYSDTFIHLATTILSDDTFLLELQKRHNRYIKDEIVAKGVFDFCSSCMANYHFPGEAAEIIEVNGEKIRIVYFPHSGNPREWELTAGITVNLKSGINRIRLHNSERTKSQKDVYVPINIDLLRLRRIR